MALVGNTGLNSIANDVSQQGFQAAHRASKQTGAATGTSNFGNETKIGSSQFQQANERVAQDGQRATAENMKETLGTIENFEQKQAYTKNATLSAIRQSTLDISQ